MNFAQPNQPLQSLEQIALHYNFSFDAPLIRDKPLAAIVSTNDTILLFTNDFAIQKSLKCPFSLATISTFTLSYDTAFFIEEKQIIIWPYASGNEFTIIPNTFAEPPRSARLKNGMGFIEVTTNEIIRYTFHKG
ncbi:MAG: hypothetical protein KBT36_00565 [Kurthia sp.]|nr:hypothetical protein [Candidatus Kurthia equi]